MCTLPGCATSFKRKDTDTHDQGNIHNHLQLAMGKVECCERNLTLEAQVVHALREKLDHVEEDSMAERHTFLLKIDVNTEDASEQVGTLEHEFFPGGPTGYCVGWIQSTGWSASSSPTTASITSAASKCATENNPTASESYDM